MKKNQQINLDFQVHLSTSSMDLTDSYNDSNYNYRFGMNFEWCQFYIILTILQIYILLANLHTVGNVLFGFHVIKPRSSSMASMKKGLSVESLLEKVSTLYVSSLFAILSQFSEKTLWRFPRAGYSGKSFYCSDKSFYLSSQVFP